MSPEGSSGVDTSHILHSWFPGTYTGMANNPEGCQQLADISIRSVLSPLFKLAFVAPTIITYASAIAAAIGMYL